MTIDLAMQLGVQRTLARYAHALDGRDAAGFAALFAPDGELTMMGQTMRGRAAIEAWAAGRPDGPAAMHLTANPVVTPAGPGRAEAISYVAVIRRHDDGWRHLVAGTYHDDLAELAGEWLITHRRITVS